VFYQNGKHDEAWMILKQVHDTNMRAKGYPERVFSVSTARFIPHSFKENNNIRTEVIHGNFIFSI